MASRRLRDFLRARDANTKLPESSVLSLVVRFGGANAAFFAVAASPYCGRVDRLFGRGAGRAEYDDADLFSDAQWRPDRRQARSASCATVEHRRGGRDPCSGQVRLHHGLPFRPASNGALDRWPVAGDDPVTDDNGTVHKVEREKQRQRALGRCRRPDHHGRSGVMPGRLWNPSLMEKHSRSTRRTAS